MKENCFDEGTIQAFLDGELASDLLENTARHLATCGRCAAQLAAAEEETAFAFSALEHEFNTLVPTQRLWTKINDSIERERKPFWQTVFVFLKNPALVTFAAFLIVFGLFVAYMNSSNNNSTDLALAPKTEQKTTTAISNPLSDPGQTPPEQFTKASPPSQKDYRFVNANFESNKQRNSPAAIQNDVKKPQPAIYEYLPGEESYIKTIATLEKTVDDRKDEVLRPSSRVSFEKDLALANDAIKKMQTEIRKNPKNEAARQVLLDSYQNKVDLLNSVTSKTELMASLK